MGSPKALLQYRGETFLDRLIGLFARHSAPVIAVLGAQAETVQAGLHRAAEATLVTNSDYRLGQLSSMQCGLRAIPASAGDVLFTLVDHPAVRPGTIDALLTAPPAPLCIARFQGRRGHPVRIARALVPEFLALPPEATAREVIARYAESVVYADVDDPGVVADIDDPDAYARLLTGSAA